MNLVRKHYETYPYPHYPLLVSVRRCDTYALSLETVWGKFNDAQLPSAAHQILIAGCGSFSPYPFSLANPDCIITALDLSAINLRRARMHCLLHLRRNVSFVQGDLLDAEVASEQFGFIDAFGVLHHLPDPAAGLSALKERLLPSGIIRLMLYSNAARKRTEAARRMLRRLGVTSFARLQQLKKQLPKDAALLQALDDSPEKGDKSGIADAFLHPQVCTFTVNQLEKLITDSGLRMLMFAHNHALADTDDEFCRLYKLEKNKELDFNFQVYLGNSHKGKVAKQNGRFVKTNPAVIGHFPFLNLPPQGRLGHRLPVLDDALRNLLYRCRKPQKWESFSKVEQHTLQMLEQQLLVYSYCSQ